MIVRGVYRDIPENTMFKADFVVSVHKEGGYKDGAGWGGNDIFYAVFRTGEASDIEVVNDNIQRMVEKYMPTEHNGWKLELSVIPLATKHQTSSETTKRLVIYGFLGFSIFFVAIMNYMLIVIATLGRRAKSVGVHKCNGANNGNIFSMFMMETGIIVLVSILVCAFIIFNARDLIEDLLSVRLASLFTWGTLWVPLLVVVLLFLLAGVLPGRIFSHIPVTQVFRRYTDGKKGWKRSLLFIQFTGVSFVLGLLLVTLMQYSHLMNRDMGINTAGLVEAESWLDIEIVPHMRDEIRRQPMVESVATASHSVLGQYWTKGLIACLPISSSNTLFSINFIQASAKAFTSLSGTKNPFLPLSMILFAPVMSKLTQGKPQFIASTNTNGKPSYKDDMTKKKNENILHLY